MGEAGYFGESSVIESMSAEHLYLWRAFFRASEPHMRPGMRVLDFGCGDGSMLAYLMLGDGRTWSGWPCGSLVGIDRPSMRPVLAKAAKRLGDTLPILFSTAPASRFPEQFDLVMSHEVIYLLPSLEKAFRELHASLKSGGVIALATGCHRENGLYARWRRAFARVGVDARTYGLRDYVRALAAAGFEGIDCGRLRLSPEEYDEWVEARGEREPNPSWFRTMDEERRYYVEFGKALIIARRVREPARDRAAGRP